MDKLLYITLLLSLSLPCLSTCIVAVRMKDGFYIAADTRVSTFVESKRKLILQEKVYQEGKYIYTASSISLHRTFDVASTVCEASTTFSEIPGNFFKCKFIIEENLTNILASGLPEYSELLKPENPVSDVIFGGYENGIPKIWILSYIIKEIKNKKVSVVSHTNIWNSDMIVLGGNTDHYLKTLFNNDVKLRNKKVLENPEFYIKEIIRIEAEAAPDFVSLPVTGYFIGKSGIRKFKWR